MVGATMRALLALALLAGRSAPAQAQDAPCEGDFTWDSTLTNFLGYEDALGVKLDTAAEAYCASVQSQGNALRCDQTDGCAAAVALGTLTSDQCPVTRLT